MKEELIDRLFKEFDKDKEVIKKNLLSVMDNIILEARNDYEVVRLTISVEKRENKNEKSSKK